MHSQHTRRFAAVIAAVGIGGLALAGCTGDTGGGDADADCGPYEQYGTFDGAEVTIGGTILDLEADRLVESWADFESCTGISVEYQGSSEFEAQIAVLAEGGNAPDVGIVPAAGTAAATRGRRMAHPGVAGCRGQRRRVVVRGLEGLRNRR